VRREEYVRPPLVAAEAPSATLARWRYRLAALALLLVALAFFTWLFLQLSGVTGGENPGIGGLPQPQVSLSRAAAS
jgi:hypothetical protein